MKNRVYFAEDLSVLQKIPSSSVDLVYVDPPSTKYHDESSLAWSDVGLVVSPTDTLFDNYIRSLSLRIAQFHRILKDTGTLYLQIRSVDAPYVRVTGDKIFGRQNFLNEIIWAFDFGPKPKNRWPEKHENILVWAKEKGSHIFNADAIDREPYVGTGLSIEKKANGKLPTDCWVQGIVHPISHEKTGYPGQKPLSIAKRIILASSPLGGLVVDSYAGSGTVGEACLQTNRNFILVDNNSEAIKVMRKRFSYYNTEGRSLLFLNRMKETP